jgi:HD domain
MNRRELLHGVGFLGLNALTPRRNLLPCQMVAKNGAEISSAFPALPSEVAGIRLVDSEIARKAIELSRESCDPYLFNHAVRTFLFGALMGRALGQRFDEELLFLACILHDLGLTDRFQGDLPFEIQGAEAAKGLLEKNAYPKQRTEIVWDGIAMHASVIGQFKQPEIALVGEGAGADVLGPDLSRIHTHEVDEVAKAIPRLSFKTAFLKGCTEVVRRHPGGASRSFMRDIGERYVEGFRPRNFCDLLMRAPYSE